MLIEFLILFEIIAIGLLVFAFSKGAIMSWMIAAILFGILAFSFYNVEESKTLVHSVTDVVHNTSSSTSTMVYQTVTETSKDIPLVYLNMGLGALCLVFLFVEIFKGD